MRPGSVPVPVDPSVACVWECVAASVGMINSRWPHIWDFQIPIVMVCGKAPDAKTQIQHRGRSWCEKGPESDVVHLGRERMMLAAGRFLASVGQPATDQECL